MSKMHKIWLMAAAIPKTVIFNFRYLKFRDAIKFPFIVSHRVRLQSLGGKVKLEVPARFNIIRLGFHENPAFSQKDKAVWFNRGTVIFKGTAYLGNGTCVANSGELTVGDNFQVSGNSRIVCKEKMSFGDDVLISWDCLFMDGDAHAVYDISSERSGGAMHSLQFLKMATVL